MGKWLIQPPVVFLLILAVAWGFSAFFSRLAFRVKKKGEGSEQPYACGEGNYDNLAQPDYSNFFPYAFFFTLAHVATLIITTVPPVTMKTFVMAALYLSGVVIGLMVLFRR
ncbi:MAG: hypothetical protein PHY94_07475 [Candidatus Omnitrophica bacterium]|nr:hypothetical protein [Candidatus Omnitrophota bacterium]